MGLILVIWTFNRGHSYRNPYSVLVRSTFIRGALLGCFLDTVANRDKTKK